jgi:c-di-GMP-binding flagellar brake protein YcgR
MGGSHKGKVKEVTEEELRRRLADKEPSPERRTDTRLPARLEVEIPLTTWDQLRRVYTTNISKGGLLFTIESPVTLPAAVDLTLTLPDSRKVLLHSEVRHVERREGTVEYDVGVQFKALEPDVQKTLDDAVAGLD